jgi:hypothetical protein
MKPTTTPSTTRDSADYWDALAARVARQALHRAQRDESLAGFVASGRAWATAVLLVAVAIAGVSLAPARSGNPASGTLAVVVEPTDQLGRLISAASSPPSVGELLLNARATRETR